MRYKDFGMAGILTMCLAFGAAVVFADDQAKSQPKPDAIQPGLLSGPKVDVDWPDEDRPGMMTANARNAEAGSASDSDTTDAPRRNARRFDGGRRGRGGAGNAQRDTGPLAEAMRKALREVELSDGQTKTIRAAVQAFTQSMNTWRAEHKDELTSLRTRTQTARRAGDREALRTLMTEAQGLRADAPKPAELMTTIEGALSPEQLTTLKELRKKYAREVRENMNRQRDGAQRDRQRPEGERKRRQLDL